MKTSCSAGRRSFRLISALILAVVLSIQFLSAQAWYDADWSYRNEVAITHPLGLTGSTLSGYQVKITLTGGTGGNFDFSKALADLSDIRFTAADGITLIPFWIESWTAGTSATIWVKVPSIPNTGTTVFVYYGNSAPTEPLSGPVEVPPTGPFTRAEGNPIFANTAQSNLSLLAENIVYDPVSQHYWMVFANYSTPGVGLAYSDDPTDPASWNWHGNVYYHASGGSFAPHILYEDGLWYIFFAQLPNIVYMTCSTINGTYSSPTVALSPTLAWEDYRVDEPYVFKRGENDWVMIYMGDAGSATEQVGYATATSITGPWSPYAGNPCIPFTPGSYDAGTVADPWVYEYHGVYYIGYTVSPTKSSPWYTACATTRDWQTFDKIGVILPLGSGADGDNSFRGALTRIGDEYVFSYTNDGYRMAIATQPVYRAMPDIVNNPDAVFDFYDGFNTADGTDPDPTKWSFINGGDSQTNIAGGLLTITASGTYVRIDGSTFVGTGYLGETYARHPNQGTNNMIMEAGFIQGAFSNTLRIADDFPSITHWQRQNKTSTTSGDPWVNMAQTSDQGWHTFRVYRESDGSAGFQIDNNTIETVSTDVPTLPMAPFLMSFGSGNQFIVDWTRVRKWAGAEPIITVNREEAINRWTGTTSTDWNTASNWSAGHAPTSTENAVLEDVETNDPVISTGTFSCNSLVIDPGACLTVESAGTLDVDDLIIINSTGLSNTGSLINRGTVTATVLFNRFLRAEDNMGSRHFFSSPVSGMTISSFFSENINLGELWEWDETDASWPHVVSGELLSGKGYNLAQTTGSLGEYSFIGSVASSASFIATAPYLSTHISRTSSFDYGYLNPNPIWADDRSWENYGGGGWNLMGNPFTSAMSASAFITANNGLFDPNYKALYVYDGENDVYQYAAASVPGYPQSGDFGNFVQAGQGFFVLALYNGATFTFNSSIQVHQPTVAMLKSTTTSDDPWPGLQLRLQYGEKERETTIVFNDAMTTGSDPGYDIGLFSTNPDVEIYTALAAGDNSVNFARQALPATVAENFVIPVGIDTKNGGEVIFSAYTVPLGTKKFWLEDRVAGVFTDLMTKSYTVTLPANTFGTGRFFILASANTPTGIDDPDALIPDLRIWTSAGNIIVKGDLSEKSFCQIYDIQGKIVFESPLHDGEINIIEMPGNYHGVYIVKVVDGIKVVTQKVALL